MFANNLLPGPVSPGDIQVSKLLLDLWTSFATDGYGFLRDSLAENVVSMWDRFLAGLPGAS